jgi:hypothetical protein
MKMATGLSPLAASSGRLPQAIKAMSPKAIYSTLTSGVMKAQAERLSTGQIIALITSIAPAGKTHGEAPSLTVLADNLLIFANFQTNTTRDCASSANA